jgi:hypothetical protein
MSFTRRNVDTRELQCLQERLERDILPLMKQGMEPDGSGQPEPHQMAFAYGAATGFLYSVRDALRRFFGDAVPPDASHGG